MENEKYEIRIVAYGDILGWNMAATQVNEFSRLQKAVRSIADYATVFSLKNKKSIENAKGMPENFCEMYQGIEFSYFSDNFAVSVPLAHGEILFKILANASDTLLHERFLVRGGVTIGEVYHSQGIIFGPALLEAVAIEQKEAFYPRFLCSKKLVERLNEESYKPEPILQDCCQEWVVNIAYGSSINRDQLMEMIRNESHTRESAQRKWRYMETMLPKMFLLKAGI